MGGTPEDRLRWKEPLHSFEIELQGEFGLSPALVRRYREWLQRVDRAEHQPVLERLLRRFGPIELSGAEDGEEVDRG